MIGAYFCINVKQYNRNYDFEVICPASIDYPRDNAVMFVREAYIFRWANLLTVKDCLIFWPEEIEIPEEIEKKHLIVLCQDTRLEYCRFFKEHGIRNLPPDEEVIYRNGSWLAVSAVIGEGTVILPGAYISGGARIGKNCYIGAGSKLMGEVTLGNSVVIRENTVIGADGLSTDRDKDGAAVTMPQFGGVTVGNFVDIGANCVIARGAIDNTVIGDGCKIDNSVFISHNVHLGRDTFIVGETIMFGSSSTGERVQISGNAVIRNKVRIGSDVTVGMGAVVTKDVGDGLTVMGNPAHVKGEKR